ncbi:hypothetical protein [Oceanobacillus sp. J11TS1]|uniref:hypothetical protein n=1 Tax=Oceanobacillus sp. J11TS1 TaxID=2807191 RepID=UPI001B05E074|nr:hypothetical protein [Oceanobacillus sp. J11TS1]GIO22654.1 hypothetical protein J11TS1_12350 [Oceanobacillus sp. J11TS1]
MMLLSKSIVSEENNAHSKEDMERQMEQIQEQLTLIHLKLKAKVDSEVWVQFQTKSHSIKQVELEFQKLKQLL